MIVLRTTVPDSGTADRMSGALVGSGLCASCSSYPIRSVYRWKGEIHDEAEVMLEFRTTPAMEDRLRGEISNMHPYELPVIDRSVVETDDEVENWLCESTSVRGQS